MRGSEKFPFKRIAEFKAKCNFNKKKLIWQHTLFTCSTAVTSNPRDLPYSTALHQDEKKPTTVDVADVKHHSKMKEHWWDVNGPLEGLHAFNYLRYNVFS